MYLSNVQYTVQYSLLYTSVQYSLMYSVYMSEAHAWDQKADTGYWHVHNIQVWSPIQKRDLRLLWAGALNILVRQVQTNLHRPRTYTWIQICCFGHWIRI